MSAISKQAFGFLLIVLVVNGTTSCTNARTKEHINKLVACLSVGMSVAAFEEKCIPMADEYFTVIPPDRRMVEEFRGLQEGCESGCAVCTPSNVYEFVSTTEFGEIDPLYSFAKAGSFDYWDTIIFVGLSKDGSKVVGWWWWKY